MLESVRPLQDCLYRQARPTDAIPNSALGIQQWKQRASPWQSAQSLAEGIVHGKPGLSRRIQDGTGFDTRPALAARLMGIRPCQNLSHGIARQLLSIALAAVFGEQSRQ
jgi:hypothetical protein